MALVRITSAIFNNENSIIPISVLNSGEYDCETNIYIGLPAVLNRDGVHHIVRLNLNADETNKLKHSATILRNNLASIDY